MAEERDYGMFDDDAEDLAPEETVEESEKKKKKKKKKKVDREGSKKNKAKRGKLGTFVKVVIGGGIVLFVASGLLLGKGGNQTTKPAQSAPQDDYYLTVNFTDVENMELEDLFIYSEGGQHTLVYMIEGTDDAMSVCDNYVIEDVKTNDGGSSLTPLEGTELFESIINECNVQTINKVDAVSFAGVKYYISVDGSDVRSKLCDSDCAEIVSIYVDEDGTTYDNLSDFLAARANRNNLGKAK